VPRYARISDPGFGLAWSGLWRLRHQCHPRRIAFRAQRATRGGPCLWHVAQPGVVARPYPPDVGLCPARPLQCLDADRQGDFPALAAADRRYRHVGRPSRRPQFPARRRSRARGLALALLPGSFRFLHPRDAAFREGLQRPHASRRPRHIERGALMDILLHELSLFAPAVWYNIYFAAAAIPLGFIFAVLLALGKASPSPLVSRLSRFYVYAFRGSPLFIQFFMVYSLTLSFNIALWKPWGISWFVLHPLFIGPLVLMLNTAAYTAEIFYGALRAVPRGEI